jgi:hypothetical protein
VPDTPTYGDVLRYDDRTVPQATGGVSQNPFAELGSTGLKRATGIIDEEYLPALRGRKAVKVFKEMSDNDPMVGSLLFAVEKLLRQVTWRVESVDNTPEHAQAQEFLEQCMEDMSHTWDDLIAEILSCLIYGWSWHEIVYKKRVGPWEKDPTKKSKFTDGKIGWRKMPVRSQETLLRWMFDETGGVQAMVQMAPPYYTTTVLPINKSLLFRTGLHKGNPEGRSILRTAYRPWFMKKRLEEFEAIGVERDLAGMPVAKVPSSYMNAQKGSKEHNAFLAFKRMVQNVRRDEHEGLVLPLEYDPVTKQPMFEFELMSSGGARSFDTSAIIQRYEQRILMTVLADFIMVGHEGQGSYAMHVDKTGIFRAALNTIAETIADTFNRHAVPRLFELNAWKLDELPKIVPNNVDPPNLAELGQFMTSMAGMGMEWFPDPDLEKFLREVAHLPEMPEEVEEMRRDMAQQSNLMSYAQTRMDVEGMAQQEQRVAAGESPAQAQMAQEQPSEAAQEQQVVGEQRAQARASMDPEVQQSQQVQMQQQMEMQAQDPTAQVKAESDQAKAKADMDMKSIDLQTRERDAKRDQQLKDRDAKRDQDVKDKDAKRDQQMKDADLKRKEREARIKAKNGPTPPKTKKKAKP